VGSEKGAIRMKTEREIQYYNIAQKGGHEDFQGVRRGRLWQVDPQESFAEYVHTVWVLALTAHAAQRVAEAEHPGVLWMVPKADTVFSEQEYTKVQPR
jgi:hypothetical protein